MTIMHPLERFLREAGRRNLFMLELDPTNTAAANNDPDPAYPDGVARARARAEALATG